MFDKCFLRTRTAQFTTFPVFLYPIIGHCHFRQLLFLTTVTNLIGSSKQMTNLNPQRQTNLQQQKKKHYKNGHWPVSGQLTLLIV